MQTIELKAIEEDNEGFVSGSKGITLSILSLGVWTATLLMFQLTNALVHVNYAAFCLFASFILSTISGLYVSKLIYRRNDKWKPIAIALNILLIYSSTNGIQAGHAALAKQENAEAVAVVQKSGLFTFLDARPWLRDATCESVINALRSENNKLKNESEELRSTLNSLKAGKEPTDLENARLKQQNDDLLNQLSRCRDQSTAITEQRTQYDTLINRIAQQEQQLNTYYQFRAQWIDKYNGDEKFRMTVSKFEVFFGNYFGSKYYQRLFQY